MTTHTDMLLLVSVDNDSHGAHEHPWEEEAPLSVPSQDVFLANGREFYLGLGLGGCHKYIAC